MEVRAARTSRIWWETKGTTEERTAKCAKDCREKQKIEGLRNWEDISDTACHKEDRLNSLLKQKTKSPLIRGRRNHSIHNVLFTGQAKKWKLWPRVKSQRIKLIDTDYEVTHIYNQIRTPNTAITYAFCILRKNDQNERISIEK